MSGISSQYATVKYDFLGQTYASSCADAADTAEKLCSDRKAVSLKFTDVVIARSTVEPRPPNLQHELSMWTGKGPFTPQQFLKMMQYPLDISNKAWMSYMQSAAK